MKLNTGMILFTFILLKLSYFTKSLPMSDRTNYDNVPAYARPPQVDISHVDSSEDEEDELSGDFTDDYHGDGVMRDAVVKRKKVNDVWKVNMNQTKGNFPLVTSTMGEQRRNIDDDVISTLFQCCEII